MICLSLTPWRGVWLSPIAAAIVVGLGLFALIRRQSTHWEGKPSWSSFLLTWLGFAFFAELLPIIGAIIFRSQRSLDFVPAAFVIGLILSELFLLWTER